jgi:hypothetical protein
MLPPARLFFTLLALLSLLPLRAPGMTVEDFGRMDDDDDATYVAVLIEASAQILRAQGHPDQATQVIAYFKVPGKFGGVQQFAAKLQEINATNKRNATNPNMRGTPLMIEDAMVLTLREKGFNVSAKDLIAHTKTFKPEDPPRAHPIGTG